MQLERKTASVNANKDLKPIQSQEQDLNRPWYIGTWAQLEYQDIDSSTKATSNSCVRTVLQIGTTPQQTEDGVARNKDRLYYDFHGEYVVP